MNPVFVKSLEIFLNLKGNIKFYLKIIAAKISRNTLSLNMKKQFY